MVSQYLEILEQYLNITKFRKAYKLRIKSFEDQVAQTQYKFELDLVQSYCLMQFQNMIFSSNLMFHWSRASF